MDFKIIKNRIKKKYNISGKKLSDVIEIIKNHYEFSRNIECDIPLKGIDEEVLIMYLDEIYDFYEEPPDGIYGVNICQNPKLVYEKVEREELKNIGKTTKIIEKLNPKKEQLAAVYALYEHANSGYPVYSEKYVAVYDKFLKKYTTDFTEKTQRIEFSFLLSNSFLALDNIAKSLFALRKNSLACKVIERYKIEFPNIDINALKNGSYFYSKEYLTI